MATPSTTQPVGTKHSPQNIFNWSFDDDYGILFSEGVGYDGVTLQRVTADALAVKITVVGSITYIGIAAPGTAQATGKWQCKKIDETTGIVITWADGNASFDNASTDLTALSYS